MAATQRNPIQPSLNGVITAPAKGLVGGNRKKQKRRAKQAAKAAAPLTASPTAVGQDADVDYDEDPLGYNDEDDYEYSDAEQAQYHDSYAPSHNHHHHHHHHHHHASINGYDASVPSAGKKSRRKKKKAGGGLGHDLYETDILDSRLSELPNLPSMVMPKRGSQQQNIWDTSAQQERQNIKNFWLSLSEDERKDLLKIEKEDVLRKMKQQQKHSCTCTVCGRKRTAIEEELEVLYEGYYEELEQYAHHDHPPLSGSTDLMLPAPLAHPHRPHPLAAPPPPPPQPHHRSSQILEHLDEDEEYSEGDDEYSEDEYSEEEPEPPRGPMSDFLNFGQNLTVKDNVLTVADDLLKNDGRKFIEMMEQLAERRMQRETEARYAAANPSHPDGGYHPNDPGYANDDLEPGEEFDDEEASYDSQEEYEDDLEQDDEMSGLTAEQRMQEGRRMFQIFAARMFEHRVYNAYKERVAAERQQRLLEELQDEEKQEAQREAKKKRDAEKKKDKKKQQQAAKAEEKAKREAEKAAEEARLREAEEQKLEEARRKKDEQRRKKDDEKRKLEEDRQKKEADRLRRQQEEQQRREDAERKTRELKAVEKARKDEARKREKEEREAREKSARERKAQQDETERREREVRPRPDSSVPQVAKRPSHQNMVAVPGVFPKQTTPLGFGSPKPTVATPAIPKGPAPAKRSSQQGSYASSPKQPNSQVSSIPSKSSSPGSAMPLQQQQQQELPKTILHKTQAPVQQHSQMQNVAPMSQQHIQPPPGMIHPQQHPNGFSPMPGMGFPPVHGMPGMRSPMPIFPHAGAPMPLQNRVSSFGTPTMNGMHGPPGMMANHQGRPNGVAFDGTASSPNAPPGFVGHMPQQASNHTSPIGIPINGLTQQDGRAPHAPHSRQQSVTDKFDATIGQAINRPAPIQRPSSVKPQGSHNDMDNLSKHLGSSALLDDDDVDADQHHALGRRISQRTGPLDSLGSYGSPVGAFGAPGSAWAAPSPFAQAPSLGHQWGSLPTAGAGWNNNNNSFTSNSGFGSMGGATGLHRPSMLPGSNRPLTIRIAVCHACKQLSGMSPSADGFHDIDVLLRQIEHNRPPLDSAPTLKEIEDICETEGDAQNGGGELQVQKAGSGSMLGVRWQAGALTPDIGRQPGHGSLGEIGSPLPAKSTPAFGFGAPGMGRSSISGWTTGH